MPEASTLAAVIVLAAGAGTRMRSALPKVLHPLAGRPLLDHAVRAAAALAPADLVVVVGHGREQVSAYLHAEHPGVRQAVQAEQLGTGHAVSRALDGRPTPAGTVLVTYGDVPLLTTATLTELLAEHHRSGHGVTILTAQLADPTGYGRIVRDGRGAVTAIVEQRDADPGQQRITEINSGIYAFDGPALAAALPRLTGDNAAGERYLTDVVALLVGAGRSVGTVAAEDPVQTEGVNDRVQLSTLARTLNDRLIRALQLSGVTVLDPATTWVHADVTVGPDTVLLPHTSLEAGTTVGSQCSIGPDTTLAGCRVADGATVLRSHCTGAVIGERSRVGPFTFLRPGSLLADGAKVGAYVEVKSSTVGPGAKVPHLTYIGDASIGAGTNIGAGAITANYDGAAKYPTVIGEQVFIGTNATLVAPLRIGDGAFVAAGSTVTTDVAPGDLAIGRARQSIIRGWIARRRPGTPADRAARRADRSGADAAGGPDSPAADRTDGDPG